jgi:Fanconi anemia group M protein
LEFLWIVVDANEARTGLAGLLAASWDFVDVRRLSVGDIAVGRQVLIERKTADDFVSSLADGRLFRQARRLTSVASRPIVIQEGDAAEIHRQMDPGAYRGALLSLTVGFRIPVLMTRDLEDTARLVRHMAAQESKRESRRLRRARSSRSTREADLSRFRLAPDAIEVLCAMPGVGRARAEALATHVKSLRDLAQLGVHDLMAVPGIGPDTAARIVDVLREHRRENG